MQIARAIAVELHELSQSASVARNVYDSCGENGDEMVRAAIEEAQTLLALAANRLANLAADE